ncbi:Tetratricopeptide repeat protein 38 [Plasmodiophora brassicae]
MASRLAILIVSVGIAAICHGFDNALPRREPPSFHPPAPEHLGATRVDEFGRPIVPPVDRQQQRPDEFRPAADVPPRPHILVPIAVDEYGREVLPPHEDPRPVHRGEQHAPPTAEVHQANEGSTHEVDHARVAEAANILGNAREGGDDLEVHVGKNKVKTETVATITATITATDEKEDSYIKVHRDAHEASLERGHDAITEDAREGAHHDQGHAHLDGDVAVGPDGVAPTTPPPDLSFLQDVEVLKVLFPFIDKKNGGAAQSDAKPALDGPAPPAAQ